MSSELLAHYKRKSCSWKANQVECHIKTFNLRPFATAIKVETKYCVSERKVTNWLRAILGKKQNEQICCAELDKILLNSVVPGVH